MPNTYIKIRLMGQISALTPGVTSLIACSVVLQQLPPCKISWQTVLCPLCTS